MMTRMNPPGPSRADSFCGGLSTRRSGSRLPGPEQLTGPDRFRIVQLTITLRSAKIQAGVIYGILFDLKGKNEMAKNKLFGLISAVLFLLVGIFTLLKLYSLSAMGISMEVPGLFKMDDTLATIAAIVLILVAVCGLVCALLGKYKIAMIAALVELIVFIVVFFVLKGKLTKEPGDYASLASFHIAFIGWLHMIFTVAAGALAFLASKDEA